MRPVMNHGPTAVPCRPRSRRLLTSLLLLAILSAALLARADVASAANYYELQARHSNKCLDVAYASTSHGANVVQADCWGGRNQQWRLEYVSGGGYEVITRHSDRCLDVSNYSYLHAANVIQGNCWGGLNQQWKFVPTDSGHYKLVARHSNMCLDVAHGSIAHGANVLQATCWSPGYNQQWRLVYVGSV